MNAFALWGLWLIAIALVGLGLLNWREVQGRPRRPIEFGGAPGLAALIGAALFMLLLTSCAGAPPVKTVIQRVEVPVAVQPIRADQVPQLPAPLAKRPANVSAALDLALAKVCEFVSYGIKANPLLEISAGLPATDPPRFPECEGR